MHLFSSSLKHRETVMVLLMLIKLIIMLTIVIMIIVVLIVINNVNNFWEYFNIWNASVSEKKMLCNSHSIFSLMFIIALYKRLIPKKHVLPFLYWSYGLSQSYYEGGCPILFWDLDKGIAIWHPSLFRPLLSPFSCHCHSACAARFRKPWDAYVALYQ